MSTEQQTQPAQEENPFAGVPPPKSDTQTWVNDPTIDEAIKQAPNLQEALKVVWTPGTELTRKTVRRIAKLRGVAESTVYGARRKIGVAMAAQAEAIEPPPSPVHVETSSGLQVEVTPIRKVVGRQDAPGGVASPITQTPTAAPFEEWTAKEIKPIIQIGDQVADMAKVEHDTSDPQPIAELWAATLNAFEIPKGEQGGKYLVLISAVTITFIRYAPGLKKYLPGLGGNDQPVTTIK